ncbi:MAG TPA: hypothetical protein VFW45_08175 [Candidatus Polarisedimenticolia bacterium]|nr:hypothetical protein [Candidatus Polarisedimenticolia bacterium]
MSIRAAQRPYRIVPVLIGLLTLLLSARPGIADGQEPPPAEEKAPARTAPQTAPAASPAAEPVDPSKQGTLTLKLDGNRQFCVVQNELEFSDAARQKPRQQRNSPLITTMGYKYQISVSRRGTSGVTKLFESPTIRTTYYEKPKPTETTPQPRLPTEKDKKEAGRPFGAAKKIPRWIPDSACTTLKPEYSFPLLEGRYDVYLGFDLLTPNGHWVPLQSDFIVDLTIEKGKEAKVQGKVDYSAGERVVTLGVPAKKASSGSR